MVKPADKRRLAKRVQKRYAVSLRRTANVLQTSRKSLRHKPKPRIADTVLKQKLSHLGYPRYGYRTLHAVLRRQGLVVNCKRTYRLYKELNMQVRTKKRRKVVRPRVHIDTPMCPNECWSLDFVSDQLATGRRIRVLNIVDNYSHVCVAQIVDTSISGARLVKQLDELSKTRGLPQALLMDNGPEFTSKAMFFWSQRTGVKLKFI